MDNHAPAVTRAIRILELLRTTSDPMRLSEVSSKLELVPSSCLHILRALVEERFVGELIPNVDAKKIQKEIEEKSL